MKVDLPNIKSVKSGSTNVKKICHGSLELWPDYQSYTLYDWVQNTSPAYINTGINPRREWKYQCKITLNSNSFKNWFTIYGTRGNNHDNLMLIKHNTNKNIENRIIINGTNYRHFFQCSPAYKVGSIIESIIDFPQKKSTIIIDGKEYYNNNLGYITESTGEICNLPMFMFTTDRDGSYDDSDRPGQTFECKFYYLKIFNSSTDELVHNFVPAVYNNVHGFIDTVTNTFVTNANSSGTLTCGND